MSARAQASWTRDRSQMPFPRAFRRQCARNILHRGECDPAPARHGAVVLIGSHGHLRGRWISPARPPSGRSRGRSLTSSRPQHPGELHQPRADRDRDHQPDHGRRRWPLGELRERCRSDGWLCSRLMGLRVPSSQQRNAPPLTRREPGARAPARLGDFGSPGNPLPHSPRPNRKAPLPVAQPSAHACSASWAAHQGSQSSAAP